MSVKMEYKGKDVDEAINLACEKLNATRSELDIEIVTPGSAGFLGFGRKKAVILAAKKETAGLEDTGAGRAEDGAISPLPPPPGKIRAAKEDIFKKADAALAKSPSPETIESIRTAAERVLRLMGYPASVEMSCNGSKVTGHISGDHLDKIIGRDGCVIDALQYLLRKMISQRFQEKMYFSLDAGDYRETRRKELEALALELAEQVKATGRSRVTSALNPAERRIIHVMLQNDRQIRSASVGDGMFKKIKI